MKVGVKIFATEWMMAPLTPKDVLRDKIGVS